MPLLWKNVVGVTDEFIVKVKAVAEVFFLGEATNSLDIAESAIVAVATRRAATALVADRFTIAVGSKI